MAVAVKSSPEAPTSSPLDRMPVISLIGVVYVLGSLGVVFKALPALWRLVFEGTALDAGKVTGAVVLGMLMLAAVTGLIVLGNILLGSKAPAGTKAGIFFGFVGLLLGALLVRWASMWIEYWAIDLRWFGSYGFTLGWMTTAALAVLVLYLVIRWMFRPTFERRLAGFESQGWFSTHSYKQQQGQKVRRGTILGILLLGGAGVYTMISHGILDQYKGDRKDWSLNIPFTGKVTVNYPGDALEILSKKGYPENKVFSRVELQEINDGIDPAKYVKIDLSQMTSTLNTKFRNGQIVSKAEYDEELQRLAEQETSLPGKDIVDRKEAAKKQVRGPQPEPAEGSVTYASIPLLPDLRYTLPLLIIALTIWIGWRLVNMPAFADFLIATEAELNKVSWATKKKLYQDTIVVLVTVFLMAVYLFTMDQAWSHLLSWKQIGVIVTPEDKSDANKKLEEKPY
jgi:preprotein translocase SecE subunit